MKYLISFLFLALAFSMKSEAKVTLPSILGDNMVLQQQAEVKLWGKARPNATVTVKTLWNGQTYKFSSDGKGGWSLTVSTPVAGGPYKIIFNDGELLTLQNVLIGEVWFCSGQSNMEMPMGCFDRQPVRGRTTLLPKPNHPRLSECILQIQRMGDGYASLVKRLRRTARANGWKIRR